MGLVAEAVTAVREALSPQGIESLLKREAEIRAQRAKVEPGGPADGSLGLELQRVEGKLRVLRDEQTMQRLHAPRPAPAPEDQRVTRARSVLAEADLGLSVAQENAAQAKTTLAQQEAEGAPEKQREASIRAVTIGDSNVRAAAAVVERARAVVVEACAAVEAERLEAAKSIVRAKLAAFASHALPAVEARGALADAIEEARAAGITNLEAPPLTLGAALEYVTMLSGRLS